MVGSVRTLGPAGRASSRSPDVVPTRAEPGRIGRVVRLGRLPAGLVAGTLAGFAIVLIVARSRPTRDLHLDPHQCHLGCHGPNSDADQLANQRILRPPMFPHTSGSGGTWIGVVLLVLLMAATAALSGYAIYRFYRAVRATDWSQLRRRRPSTDAPEAPDDPRAVLADAVQDSLDHDIEDGEPAEAIVACWRRFEAAAAAAGLVRGPTETSMEFTLRLLHGYDVDPASAGRLGRLYREARFSTHTMSERERWAAREALVAISIGLHESRPVTAGTTR